MDLEGIIVEIGIWLLHIGRVAVLVLFGITCLILVLRCLSFRYYHKILAQSGVSTPSTVKLNLLILALSLCLSISLFYAFQPDIQFLNFYAQKEMTSKNYEEASLTYEILTRADETQAYNFYQLGFCYLQIGKYQEAIRAFHHLHSIEPNFSAVSYMLCASAHKEVGETNIAIEELKKATTLTQSPEQQKAIRTAAESLQNRVGAPN